MRQCFDDLLRALEAICLERNKQLATMAHYPQSIKEFYLQSARELDAYPALLLSHLLPHRIDFADLHFSELEHARATADLRATIEEVLTAVLMREDLTVPDPSHMHVDDYAHELLYVLRGRRLFHFLLQFNSWYDIPRHARLRALLDRGLDWLAPLAVAACMLCVDDPQGYEGDELPDALAAAKAEMWLRDTVMSSVYLAFSVDKWESEDDAQMERDRRALVEAVQLMHSATDGAAAAELLRVRDDMQQRLQQVLAELERLSQCADALQRRLAQASRARQ